MISIRSMHESDRASVLEMMRVFYASPAVHTNGSERIFQADISACVGDSPYAEGYVFEQDGVIAGYGMIAKSFSTEFGKPCIWIGRMFWSLAVGERYSCAISSAATLPVFFISKVSVTASSEVFASLAIFKLLYSKLL